MQTTQYYRLLPVISGLFVACLLISNVMNAKFIHIGFLTITGGTIVFPFSFIFGDILTEVYGYAQSRKIVWTGFATLVLASVIFYVVQILPVADFWQNQAAYDSIFGAIPRIVCASMAAYFCGEFCNSIVLSKMKFFTNGRRGISQAWRFIASTIVGEAVDSVVFFFGAFLGVLAFRDIVTAALSAYFVKVVIEIVMTPISSPLSNWIKGVEGVDQIDRPGETSYNPFLVNL